MRAAPKRAYVETPLDLPKLRERDSGVPAKVLLVDDDELELSLMADRLSAAGYQVTVATNGEEALKLLAGDWFPLILTDWQMPVMDGIQLVEKMRERGGSDSFFIMLSVRAASDDFERGYGAGVDDYLSKKSPSAEIMARVEAGLNTVALRRSLRQSRAALAITQTQIAQAQNETLSTDAKIQLTVRLQSEIARATRYRRACSLLVLGIHPAAAADSAAPTLPNFDAALRMEFMQALRNAIRIDIDAVVLYDSGDHHVQFAIVLPETGPAEVATIRSRVRAALLQCIRVHIAVAALPADTFDVSVGAASVDLSLDLASLCANDLLTVAENCRSCMASCGAQRLTAVQSSVINKLAIPCRHGYAVADHCLELNYRYADERDAGIVLAADSRVASNGPFS